MGTRTGWGPAGHDGTEHDVSAAAGDDGTEHDVSTATRTGGHALTKHAKPARDDGRSDGTRNVTKFTRAGRHAFSNHATRRCWKLCSGSESATAIRWTAVQSTTCPDR